MKFNREKFYSESGQMLPSASAFDMSDSAPVQPEVGGNFLMRSTVSAYGNYLLLSNLSVRSFAVSVAFVVNHILRIISHSSRTQMCGITARGIVTDKMANHLVGNVFACCQFIHQSVHKFAFSFEMNAPVTVMVDIASPKPAVIRFDYLTVKSFFSRAIGFELLITRIRAVFRLMFFYREVFTAASAGKFSIDLRSSKLAFIRAVNPLGSTKREEGFAALFANTGLRYSDISHVVFSYLENNLIRLGEVLSAPFRAVFILPRIAIISYKIGEFA